MVSLYLARFTGLDLTAFSQDDTKDAQTAFFDLGVRVAWYYLKRVGFLVEFQNVGVPPMDGFDTPGLWDCEYDQCSADRKHSRFAVFLSDPIFLTRIVIKGDDLQHSQGGYCHRHWPQVFFPDDRTSARGQLERGAPSGNPYEAAPEADHRTRSFRGLVHFLSSSPTVHLTLEPCRRRSSNGFSMVRQSSRNYRLRLGLRPSPRTRTR